MTRTPRPFLTAQWRDLVLLSWEVPEALLAPLVPAGTTLDHYDGRLLASVVGFRFLGTRIRGIPIPFHGAFEEVNLRFYVRREAAGESRRGVVFVRELVPKRAVAWIARMAYNEPYRRMPMGHAINPPSLEYTWRLDGEPYSIGGRISASPKPLTRPSEAEFISEHYWGYTRQRDGGTLEYRVNHPPWDVADLAEARLTGDLTRLYGPEWAEALGGPPHSAFYADGSAVEVMRGLALRTKD